MREAAAHLPRSGQDHRRGDLRNSQRPPPTFLLVPAKPPRTMPPLKEKEEGEREEGETEKVSHWQLLVSSLRLLDASIICVLVYEITYEHIIHWLPNISLGFFFWFFVLRPLFPPMTVDDL